MQCTCIENTRLRTQESMIYIYTFLRLFVPQNCFPEHKTIDSIYTSDIVLLLIISSNAMLFSCFCQFFSRQLVNILHVRMLEFPWNLITAN